MSICTLFVRNTDYMHFYSEQTRISQKFEKIYMAVRIITRLGSLSLNYLNIIVTGLTTYGAPDQLHPAWYVFISI